MGKLGQPAAHWGRIVVDDIVNTRRGAHGGDGYQSRVLNMNEGPNPFAPSDDRNFLASDFVGDRTLRVIPGFRTVKETVAKGNSFHFSRIQQARFNCGVHLGACSNAGACVGRQNRKLVCKFCYRRPSGKSRSPAGYRAVSSNGTKTYASAPGDRQRVKSESL